MREGEWIQHLAELREKNNVYRGRALVALTKMRRSMGMGLPEHLREWKQRQPRWETSRLKGQREELDFDKANANGLAMLARALADESSHVGLAAVKARERAALSQPSSLPPPPAT